MLFCLRDLQPLKVNVSEDVLVHIESVLQTKHEKEDTLKNMFQLARHMAQNDISEQLQDFRNKRALGKHFELNFTIYKWVSGILNTGVIGFLLGIIQLATSCLV